MMNWRLPSSQKDLDASVGGNEQLSSWKFWRGVRTPELRCRTFSFVKELEPARIFSAVVDIS